MASLASGSAAFAAIDKCPRRPLKRPTKTLSWELASHTKAYLEAQQYAQGYDFLYSLLAAGTSISVPAKTYVGFLAPAVQLALASTLVAYPAITTQTKYPEKIKGADAALRYLRCVHQTLDGPAYKTIRKAFTFLDERSRRRHRNKSNSPSPGAISDIEQLNGLAANTQSIWQCGDDFWHVVGWAFNCSVAHKARWARWKLWLDMMLDFLEGDWEAGMKDARDEADEKDSILQKSLIWQYVSSQDPGSRTTRRRINRAILAMGDAHSITHFHPVWPKETATLKQQNGAKKSVGNVDFEAGELGDYGSDDEDAVMRDAAEPETSLDPQHLSDAADGVEKLGGADAVTLRQRFIALLARVAQELPKAFINLEGFFDTYAEEFKSLPVAVFDVLVSTSRLPPASQVALNANSLLPVTCGKVMKLMYDPPQQQHFESETLILVATNSFARNAKVSIIVEQLFMYMLDNDLLEPTDRLRAAIEYGVRERQGVYGTGAGKRGNAHEEEQGQVIIQNTSERLLGLLEVLEMCAGKEPQPRKAKSAVELLSFGSSLSDAPDTEPEGE